ncbi:hypothetical protein F542_2560 [Bibersteinia trehalosi USDA-ARS-USMARC-188]|uniref:Uncharacterized protein n=3 Tax=Bibersteinia trehalosi TaxID=47735 RepID=W0R9W0_BIBTR|nr:hypothetical protein WQG_20030 [Bibersteinia trehalosi USDA-ARS-USMARC-192]AHG80974.1 hypothetical protein F542_2560 [Bibersteinia trehalosi USDA-ARS-USMARC-188]AHG83186.1 hypothetical protein F543_3220 [Bibersteinia trehalosi USDA-ARS-USMARC-189]AHG87212.1 hypothetical protein F544_19840 [Bibersteinia trehalosi USDA-ARS-USMARC-190]
MNFSNNFKLKNGSGDQAQKKPLNWLFRLIASSGINPTTDI